MSGDKDDTIFTAEVGGRAVQFQPLYDGGGERLIGVVAWDAHEMSDVEILWHSRRYLDEPFATMFLLPYEGWADVAEMDDEGSAWPGFGDDTSRWVRRIWACWHTLADGDAEVEVSEIECSVGDAVWRESTEPRDGYRPAAVVTLGGAPRLRAARVVDSGAPAGSAP